MNTQKNDPIGDAPDAPVMNEEIAQRIEAELKSAPVEEIEAIDDNIQRMTLAEEPAASAVVVEEEPEPEPVPEPEPAPEPQRLEAAQEIRSIMANEAPAAEAPRVKRKYTKRAVAPQPKQQTRGRGRGGRGRKAKSAAPVITPKGTTADGSPRKRRKKLSPAVRKIEHNVMRHLTREVRHTGVGWNPPILDPAWNDAIKRLESDGIVEKRPDMGGYVPRQMLAKLSSINNQVLAYIKYRFNQTGKGVAAERLIRARQQALVRLERGGKVTHTEQGFLPVEGLETTEA